MEVKIKSKNKINYESSWACAFDFITIEDIIFEPNDFKLIETWIVIEVPEWYVLQIQPRSSTFKKYKLIQTNSVWIIDQDYCWDNDTIKFPFLYLWTETLTISKGTRIGQGMFIKIEKAEFKYCDTMNWKNRWWFWTTWN